MLPRHLTFTASFDADEGDLQKAKCCYCPCSKKSVQWLELVGRIVPGAEEGMKFKCKNAFYLKVWWIILVMEKTLCIVEFLPMWRGFTRTTKRHDRSNLLKNKFSNQLVPFCSMMCRIVSIKEIIQHDQLLLTWPSLLLTTPVVESGSAGTG